MSDTLTDRESLLAAVQANRDDDATRLIYADWLEENGKVSHAGFIRSQIAGEARCPPLTVVADVEWVFGKEAHTLTREGVLGSASVYASISRGVPILVYRRGFVCSVHCTERQWMGGECERCEGQGAWEEWKDRPNTLAAEYDPSPFIEEPELVECPQCHGTGHIVGIGPRLVREHPIERVVVTDRRPVSGIDCAAWWNGDRSLSDGYDHSSDLPGDVYALLTGEAFDSERFKVWDTEQAARDAASAAYIEWAKRQGEQNGK